MKHGHYTVTVPEAKAEGHFDRLLLSRPDGRPVLGQTLLRVYPDGREVLRNTDGVPRIVAAVMPSGWVATAAALVARDLAAVAEALDQIEDGEAVALPAIARDAAAWDARYGAALDAGEDTSGLDLEAKALRARLDAEGRRIAFFDAVAERLSREAYDTAVQHGFGRLAETLYRWSRGMVVCDPPPGQSWSETYRLAARGLLRAARDGGVS